MRLIELPTGTPARVTEVDGGGSPVMLRLMEMGLVRGASVRIRKRAPFRGPLELVVEGYLLSIRRSEALRLEVALDTAASPSNHAPAPAADRTASADPSRSAQGLAHEVARGIAQEATHGVTVRAVPDEAA